MSKTIPIEELHAELAAMGQRLADQSLEGPLRNVLTIVQAGFAENFAAAAGPNGSAWPPRKPSPDDDGHPLLLDTGALFGATQEGGNGNVSDVGPRELATGVNKGVREGGIPGAAVHNFGYPARNIPQREYLYASAATLDDAADALADGALTAIFGP